MARVVSAIILAALALPTLSACQTQAASDPAADIAAIKAVEEGVRAAYRNRDAGALAGQYADRATLYIAGERARVGTEAITQGAQKDFADPAFNVTFTTGMVSVATSGELGYAKGSFTVRYTDPRTKAASGYSGYYLTLFSKGADGRWTIMEDMVSTAG